MYIFKGGNSFGAGRGASDYKVACMGREAVNTIALRPQIGSKEG